MSYTLRDNLVKLNEIARLEEGWSGYDSVPVAKDLVEAARSILKGLGKLPQPFISPFGDGSGLQIEWQNKDLYLEIEIKPCSEEGKENLFDIFLCQDNYHFVLTGTVEKEQSSINKLVQFFYSK